MSVLRGRSAHTLFWSFWNVYHASVVYHPIQYYDTLTCVPRTHYFHRRKIFGFWLFFDRWFESTHTQSIAIITFASAIRWSSIRCGNVDNFCIIKIIIENRPIFSRYKCNYCLAHQNCSVHFSVLMYFQLGIFNGQELSLMELKTVSLIRYIYIYMGIVHHAISRLSFIRRTPEKGRHRHRFCRTIELFCVENILTK